jgi:hypothetical protein
VKYNYAVPKNSSDYCQPRVGDHIRVSMHGGKIVDAVIQTALDSRSLRERPNGPGSGVLGCEGLENRGRWSTVSQLSGYPTHRYFTIAMPPSGE